MDGERGYCPGCDGEGPVGTPCEERACGRRQLHRIPEAWHRKWRTGHPERQDPVIGRRIEDYLVVDLIGRGGFGKVYLALQAPLWMKAALKLMDPVTEDPEMAAALARKLKGRRGRWPAFPTPMSFVCSSTGPSRTFRSW